MDKILLIELKARILSRDVNAGEPFKLSEHQQQLADVMVPEHFAPAGEALLTNADAKRLKRELYRTYMRTHELLSLADPGQRRIRSADLLDAALNHQKALEFARLARRLPHTRAGAKARVLARDNADVALEVLETYANFLNRRAA